MGYFNGCACCAVYNATKGYVNYYTVAMAAELSGQIDMMCLTPNLTRTNLLADTTKKAGFLESISA